MWRLKGGLEKIVIYEMSFEVCMIVENIVRLVCVYKFGDIYKK